MEKIIEVAKNILEKEFFEDIKLIHKKDAPINLIAEKDGIKYAIAVSAGFDGINSERLILLSKYKKYEILVMFVWSSERYEIIPFEKFVPIEAWRMIKIRVSLPLSYIQKADEYVKKGVYSSKNDLIRDAVHQLLLEFEKLEIGKKSPYKGSPLYQSLQGNSRI